MGATNGTMGIWSTGPTWIWGSFTIRSIGMLLRPANRHTGFFSPIFDRGDIGSFDTASILSILRDLDQCILVGCVLGA